MSNKKIMTAEEFFKANWSFSKSEIRRRNITDIMQAYAKHVLENVVPEKYNDEKLYYIEHSTFEDGFNSCIDQIKENAKQIGIEI